MGTAFGRFTLRRRLAAGGMGEVHVATCDGSGGLPTTLVVKRLLPHLERDREFLDLFLDEARIAARLVHPNVARIYELGQAEGRWYLAMEYLAGVDLRALLDRARQAGVKVGVRAALWVAAQAARGLAHAHRAADEQGRPLGVVHCDVSPQNLIIGFGGQVKLIDFGIARAARRSKAAGEEVLRGKYPYMSPEQVTEAAMDHRSDQFSLAAVLWELLAGRRLFAADGPAAAIALVERCEVAAPSTLAGPLPPGLDEAVLRALQKDPARRYADTGAFAEALEVVSGAQGGAAAAELAALVQRLFPGEASANTPAPTASQATSRAAVLAAESTARAWSALSKPAQSALMQLCVFPAVFDVEGAEAVVDVKGHSPEPFVLDLLEELRKAGLIEATSRLGPKAELVFVVPPRVKAYAEARLDEAPPKLAADARERLAARLAK